MIDPDATTTYAQYNEDIILSALLYDVENGFYVDIGASYPTVDSVTRRFYDKGWRGINVEPIKSIYTQLVKERPRDININCGIGTKSGVATFREYLDLPGHSTFDSTQKNTHSKKEKYLDHEVKIFSLEDIFKKNNVSGVQFLKIDVEGYELEVIAGNDWKKWRPEVLCIETNHSNKDQINKAMKQSSYTHFIDDGLNSYFIEDHHLYRTDGFAERVIKLDYHALKQHQYESWSEDSREIANLISINKDIEKEKKDIETRSIKLIEELEMSRSLSLKDKGFFERVKVAIYGLTVDYYSNKKKSK